MRLFTWLSFLCLLYAGDKDTSKDASERRFVTGSRFFIWAYDVVAGVFHRRDGQHEDQRDGRGEPGQRGHLRDQL